MVADVFMDAYRITWASFCTREEARFGQYQPFNNPRVKPRI